MRRLLTATPNLRWIECGSWTLVEDGHKNHGRLFFGDKKKMCCSILSLTPAEATWNYLGTPEIIKPNPQNQMLSHIRLLHHPSGLGWSRSYVGHGFWTSDPTDLATCTEKSTHHVLHGHMAQRGAQRRVGFGGVFGRWREGSPWWLFETGVGEPPLKGGEDEVTPFVT